MSESPAFSATRRYHLYTLTEGDRILHGRELVCESAAEARAIAETIWPLERRELWEGTALIARIEPQRKAGPKNG